MANELWMRIDLHSARGQGATSSAADAGAPLLPPPRSLAAAPTPVTVPATLSSASLCLRSVAVQPMPAVTIHASEGAPSIEEIVGKMVAQAAVALGAGVREFERGRLCLLTKVAEADSIAQLYTARQFMIPAWDFEAVAREYGQRVLLESGGADVDASTAEILVDGVLSVLARVVRLAAN